jgi:hypothetical protein
MHYALQAILNWKEMARRCSAVTMAVVVIVEDVLLEESIIVLECRASSPELDSTVAELELELWPGSRTEI